MSSPIGEIFVAISPETAGFVNKMKGQFAAMNFGAGGSALGLGNLVGPAIVAGAVAGLAKIGMEFGKMRKTVRLETGATGETLDKLAGTITDVFKDVPISLGDATAAVDMLYRKGVPLGPMLKNLAVQEAYLAKITHTDLGSNVKEITSLFNKWSVPLNKVPADLDAIFKASQQSGLSIGEITQPLLRNQAALKLFGFTVVESTALIANLGKGGTIVNQALGSLRIGFANLASAGKNPRQELERLSAGMQNGATRTATMNEVLHVFGKRAGPEIASAMQKGQFDIRKTFALITNGKDGIVATGIATESLGDKFKRFSNNAKAALAPVGLALMHGLKEALTSIEGPLTSTALAVGRFVVALAPVGVVLGAVLIFGFKSLGPILDAFSAGLATVADLLEKIPPPVLAIVGVLALLYGAVQSLGDLPSMIVSIVSSFGSLNVVMKGLIVAAAAITALGVVMRSFNAQQRATAEESKQMSAALFNASGAGRLFADGIAHATEGLKKYLQAQIQAGNDEPLAKGLAASGKSLDQLITMFSVGDRAWKNFTKGVIAESARVNEAAGSVEFSQGKAAAATYVQKQGLEALVLSTSAYFSVSKRVTDALNKERDAFIDSAQKQLLSATASGQLNAAQMRLIKTQSLNADGSVNWAKALDLTNASLERIAASALKSADAVIAATPSFGALFDAFASGSVGASELSTILQTKPFNFDAATAKAKIEELTGKIKDLTTAIDKAAPGFSSNLKDIKVDKITKSYDDLLQRTVHQNQMYRQLSAQGGVASTELRNTIIKNNAAIRADLGVLAKDPSIGSFVDNLRTQTLSISTFYGNLAVLIEQGNSVLARKLLDMGVEGGGALASGFASQPVQAAAANAVQTTQNNILNHSKAYILAHIAELAALGKSGVTAQFDGAIAGAHEKAPALGNALAFIAAAQSGKFKPDLATPTGRAIAAAAAVVRAPANPYQKAMEWLSTVKPDLVAPIKGAMDAAGNYVKTPGASTKVSTGLTSLAHTGAVAFGGKLTLKEQMKAKADEAAAAISGWKGIPAGLKVLGTQGGNDFGTGLASGISSKNHSVYVAGFNAADLALQGVSDRIKRKSPSKVTYGYGQDFSAGLVLGVTSYAPKVRAAGVSIAHSLVAPTQASIITGVTDATVLAAAVKQLRTMLDQVSGSGTGSVSTTATDQFKAFMSTVTSALPTSATAIANFLSEQNSAISEQVSALKDYHKAYADYAKDRTKEKSYATSAAIAFGVLTAAKLKLDAANKTKIKVNIDDAKAGVAAAQKSYNSLASGLKRSRESIAADQGSISESYKTLGIATAKVRATSDPAAFTRNLEKQTARSRAFVADLAKLVHLGYVALARELAQQGPEQAGKLADSFAGNAAKAKQANAAIRAATHWAETYQTTLQKIFDKATPPSATVNVTPKLTTTPSVIVPLVGATGALPTVRPTAAPAINVAPRPINTTVNLDLVVHLDDGRIVHATTTLPLVLDGSIDQRTKAEVHAS